MDGPQRHGDTEFLFFKKRPDLRTLQVHGPQGRGETGFPFFEK
jgi:hypothetical protein